MSEKSQSVNLSCSDQVEELYNLVSSYNTKNKMKFKTQKKKLPSASQSSNGAQKKKISLQRRTLIEETTPSSRSNASNSVTTEVQRGSESDDDSSSDISQQHQSSNKSRRHHYSIDDDSSSSLRSSSSSQKQEDSIRDDESISELSIELPDKLPEINQQSYANLPTPVGIPNFTETVNREEYEPSHHYSPTSNLDSYFQNDTSNYYSSAQQQQSKPTINSSRGLNRNKPQYKVLRKSVPGENYGINPLTIVTYNCWYHKKDLSSRTRHLVKTILNTSKYIPDIICLQEVTGRSFEILQQSLGAHYDLYEAFGDPPLPYTNLIAINRQTLEVIGDTITVYDFDSQMGRKLMVINVKVKQTGISFYVLNAHLEGFPENWKYRRVQMESIHRMIKAEKIKNFILTGDFNICQDQEPIEAQFRLYEYMDGWNELGSPQSLKYTYSYKNNPYAHMNGALRIESRQDRILYQFREDKAVITKMKLLGTKKPFCSNHYGILAEFMVKTEK